MTLADDELDVVLASVVELCAEDLDVRERLITAPRPGRFHPAVAHPIHPEGVTVWRGQRIGVVVRTGEEFEVVCPFAGVLMGLMVLPGELVAPGQALAWLVVAP